MAIYSYDTGINEVNDEKCIFFNLRIIVIMFWLFL